jgi:outer membrane protein W
MNFDVSLASAGTRRTEDVDVNPVIVGIGLGYRF